MRDDVEPADFCMNVLQPDYEIVDDLTLMSILPRSKSVAISDKENEDEVT
jgi:hypothetical protein